MPPAANLATAAGDAFANLQVKWLAGTLKASLTSFWQATLATFPEQDVASHPVSNWLTVIASIAQNMPTVAVPYEQLVEAVDAVYRLCWMTNYLEVSNQITVAQGSTGPNSILVQYNATIA